MPRPGSYPKALHPARPLFSWSDYRIRRLYLSKYKRRLPRRLHPEQGLPRYATHLLAELEQMAYTERKAKPTKETPKIKKLEEEPKGLGKGEIGA